MIYSNLSAWGIADSVKRRQNSTKTPLPTLHTHFASAPPPHHTTSHRKKCTSLFMNERWIVNRSVTRYERGCVKRTDGAARCATTPPAPRQSCHARSMALTHKHVTGRAATTNCASSAPYCVMSGAKTRDGGPFRGGPLLGGLPGCKKREPEFSVGMYDVEARHGSPFHLNRAVSSYLWRRYLGFTAANEDILRHFIIPTMSAPVDENRPISLSGRKECDAKTAISRHFNCTIH